jgi:transcriptional regulator with XRE-family HTH domain
MTEEEPQEQEDQEPDDPEQRLLGRHVKRLREVRGLTQEELAERSGLSSDTIRRFEHGNFSPSHRTLRKLCKGLELPVSQLFRGFELDPDNDGDETSELAALVRGRGRQTVSQILELARVFLRALDEQRDCDPH